VVDENAEAENRQPHASPPAAHHTETSSRRAEPEPAASQPAKVEAAIPAVSVTGETSADMPTPRPATRVEATAVAASLPANGSGESTPVEARSTQSSSRPASITPPAAPAPSQSAMASPTHSVLVAGVYYQKVESIGKGGSSRVFRVLNPQNKMFALKEVDLADADESTVNTFKNEISLLERLKDEPRIITLHGWDLDERERVLRLVMECGDVDLAKMLQELRRARSRAATKPGAQAALYPQVDENHLRLYFQQMLEAVQCIHAHRIVHGDLKPANFLSVHGALKLIDFGIAVGIQDDHTSVIRESQIGTVNYMSPEAIQGGAGGLKVGPPSDVWSLGCILYLMVYGETPFQRLTLLQKLRQIPDEKHQLTFRPIANKALLSAIKWCLERDPQKRPTIEQLLEHKFLNPDTVIEVSRHQLVGQVPPQFYSIIGGCGELSNFSPFSPPFSL
jgi:serine/threonine-protein kinase TTK/MPS1